MREWMNEHDIPLKILSLLLSFLLWFYVIGQDDPTKSLVFRELPVELIGTEELQNNRSLMLAEDEVPVVTVEISGSVSRLSSITADNITVRADVTGVEKSGEYELSYDISVPHGVTVVSSVPSDVTVHFDDLVSKELPLEVYIDGNMKAGLVALDPVIEQSTVTITGMAEELANASKALIRIPASMLDKTHAASYRYTVVDTNGEEIDSSSITHLPRLIKVRIPVQMQRMVDLTVGLRGGKGATVDDAVVEIEPKQVLLQGEIDEIQALESIKVRDTIDLGSFQEEYNGMYTITAPEGFTLVGENDTVSVNITFKDLRVHTFRSNDIELINQPEGYNFKLRDDELTVTVRGKTDVINNLVSGDVRFEVDLANVILNQESGSFKIKANAVLGEKVRDLGVFGTYEVMVDYESIVDTAETNE